MNTKLNGTLTEKLEVEVDPNPNPNILSSSMSISTNPNRMDINPAPNRTTLAKNSPNLGANHH